MSNARIKKAVEYLKSVDIDCFDNRYVAVDPEFNSLFLSTMNSNSAPGDEAQAHVYKALEVSEPLARSIQHTTAMAGTKHWHEKGLEFSWHYHPEIGLNLSVLAERTK